MKTILEQEGQMASATMELLKRCDIKGGDVPAFVQLHNWLQGKVDAAGAEVPTEAAPAPADPAPASAG